MNKKLEIKRVFIFLAILLVIEGLPWLIYKFVYGGDGMDGIYNILASYGMFTPAIAHILTRIITKEGWQNCLLGTNFKKGWKWYFIGIISILVYTVIGQLIIFKVTFPDYTAADFFSRENIGFNLTTGYLNIVSGSVCAFVICMGEEYGWRGYLFPKLEKVSNLPVALIVTGVVWGLWHYVNCLYLDSDMIAKYLLSQTISTVLFNPFFVLLTKKSGSIYPASIAHAVNNASAGTLIAYSGLLDTMSEAELTKLNLDGILNPLYMINGILLFIISTVLIVLHNKKEKAVQAN